MILNGLLTYGRILKILLHHKNVIGSIRLPNSSLVMLLIVHKFTPPIVYKLLLMEEIYSTSWYGTSTTIYAGFYTSEVMIARFLIAVNSTRTLNRTEAERFCLRLLPLVFRVVSQGYAEFVWKIWRTLPEAYMAPENPWWEDEFPPGKVYVIGRHINHWWPY